MKKVTIILMALVLVITLSGCSEEKSTLKTIAETFSADEMKELTLTELCNNYFLENVQEYTRTDGKKVFYIYSAPVEKGDNKIIEESGKFQVEGTYYNKEFPLDLSIESPILIGDNYNFIKTYIQDKTIKGRNVDKENIFGVTKHSVVYEDAFGKGIDYICYPTSIGVNTEIVISKRTKNNKFQIKIQLPDCTPDTNSPDYILFRTSLEKGEVRSIAYTPLAVDSKGNWCYANTVKLIDKDTNNNTYTLEYTIDESFLSSKKTKYPITVNQSLNMYMSKQPDTSAYENTGEIASHYLSPYILLGDNTLKGEGWTYVRYETLKKLDIDPNKIVSAKYVFNNLFDLKKEVEIAAYPVVDDWCSINTRWSNRPPFDEEALSKIAIKKSGEYELDITSLLKEMLANKTDEKAKYSIRNSFMIRCNTEGSNIAIASGDGGLFSPLLEIVLSE